MKKLFVTTALCTLLLLDPTALSADSKKAMSGSNPNGDSMMMDQPYQNKALLHLDGNFAYRNHDMKSSFLKDTKYKMATTFGIGGKSQITFKSDLDVGVMATLQYGPGLRGNDEWKFFKKVPDAAATTVTLGGTASFTGTGMQVPTGKPNLAINKYPVAAINAGATDDTLIAIGTVDTSSLTVTASTPSEVEMQKRKDGAFDLDLSQAFFYIRKGDRMNPYAFEFGKVADVTEIFGVRFNDIVAGADDYRFAVHSDVRVDNTVASAPGYQIGSDATFANFTGEIAGVTREKLYFKTYGSLYNEENSRYSPRINFISPSFHGLRAGVSYTPDGGDGMSRVNPFSSNKIKDTYNKKGIFPGDYEDIWSGGINYMFENDDFGLSLSAVGEYAEHELACNSDGSKCTQNYYDLKTFALSGMASWNNFSFFANYGNLGDAGQKRKIGDLDTGDYNKSSVDVTSKGIFKDYDSDAHTNIAVGTVKGAHVANTGTGDDELDLTTGTTGSLVDADGGYAEITRKKHETTYWSVGAAYKIDMTTLGVSYLRTETGQRDIYGGHAILDRVTGLATYQIHQGMTPYVEISWFQTKDKSTAVDTDVIESVRTNANSSTTLAAVRTGDNQIFKTDFDALKTKAGLSTGGAGTAAGLPNADKVKYLNQIGKFKKALTGQKGWILMAGVKFNF